MEDLIVLENVTKEFGDFKNPMIALENISLKIKVGEFVGVMGPSGSGKSTFLNLVATLDRTSKGKVILGGKSVKAMADAELSKFRRDNIGFIFQSYNLLDSLTLRDNIIAPLLLREINKKTAEALVEEFATKLDISKILDKFPAECSGGEVQRAAACRAIVTKPKVIIADEPTGALDSTNTKGLMKILKKLNKSEKVGIIVVTHDPYVGSYCDNVVLLKNGKISNRVKREEIEQVDYYNRIIAETAKENIDLF